MTQHLVFYDGSDNVVALILPAEPEIAFALDPDDWESVNALAVRMGNRLPTEDRQCIAEWSLFFAHEDDSELLCSGWWNPRPRLTLVH